MEAAYFEFVSQWKGFLLGYQLRNETPTLQELLDEYDYIVSYVDSIHDGFAVSASFLGVGAFSGVIHNVHRPRDPVGVALMDVAEQSSGESSSESSSVEDPVETVARVEEIIDLTLN